MSEDRLKERTKNFSLRVIKLVASLPRGITADVIGKQIIRSGTSVGANYRAACRAKSQADFIYKMTIVEEEADESIFWMELLVESKLVNTEHLADLMSEANQIVAMVVSSIKTAKLNRK